MLPGCALGHSFRLASGGEAAHGGVLVLILVIPENIQLTQPQTTATKARSIPDLCGCAAAVVDVDLVGVLHQGAVLPGQLPGGGRCLVRPLDLWDEVITLIVS